MIKDNPRLPFLSLVIAATVFVFVFYGEVLLHPNKYIFGNHGDGLKNYYTFLYHIEHDDTAFELEGMNYPYGENVLYTDGHPILSWACQLFGFHAEYGVGLINFLLILSIWLNFIILFLLLRKLKIASWLSLAGALAIGLLQPQIFKLTGHYALAYAFAIPLGYYLILQIEESAKNNPLNLNWKNAVINKWLLFFMLTNIIWLFTHAYLGVIILFLAGGYFFFDLFFSNRERRIGSLRNLIIGVCVPIFIFRLVGKLTDQHLDRTDNPMGFFDYFGSLKEVFIPIMGPVKNLADKWHGKDLVMSYEGAAYVGLWSMILGLVVLVVLCVRIIKTQNFKLIISPEGRIVLLMLVASVPVLLLSFSWPFRGNPDWLEFVPVLKQFRATGRFAWAFFYAFTIFTIWGFHEVVWTRLRIKTLKPIVLVVIIGLAMLESIPFHNHVSERITQGENLFSNTYRSIKIREVLDHIHPEQYQAILPLPFFHYGSENFHRPRQAEIVKHSFIVSQQTGLPMFGAFLTRSSIQESKNIIQLMSPNFYDKQIKYDLKSEADILVVRSKEELTRNEMNLLSFNEKIFENDQLSLYRMSKERLFDLQQKDVISIFLTDMDSLLNEDNWVSYEEGSFFLYEDFSGEEKQFGDDDNRVLVYEKRGVHEIMTIPSDSFEVGKDYTLSLWMYNKGKDVLNQWFDIRVRENDEKNGVWHESIAYPEWSEVIWGDWSRVDVEFTKMTAGSDILIETKGRENSKASIMIDDLMIRETEIDYWKKIKRGGKEYIVGNNEWLEIADDLKNAKNE